MRIWNGLRRVPCRRSVSGLESGLARANEAGAVSEVSGNERGRISRAMGGRPCGLRIHLLRVAGAGPFEFVARPRKSRDRLQPWSRTNNELASTQPTLTPPRRGTGQTCAAPLLGGVGRGFRGRRTSNTEHPTSNSQGSIAWRRVRCSALDVGCWMFCRRKIFARIKDSRISVFLSPPVGELRSAHPRQQERFHSKNTRLRSNPLRPRTGPEDGRTPLNRTAALRTPHKRSVFLG